MDEEVKMAETEQGDPVSNEGETSTDISNNSPVKRGRGRPQGSKKLKVCVTDVNLMERTSANSNGGSPPLHRKRGRPKLSDTKHTEQQGSEGDDADDSEQTPEGSKKQADAEHSEMTEHSPRKRGRPRKLPSISTADDAAAAGDLPNGGSNAPAKRGRPKGSIKRKAETLTSGEEDESSNVTPRKRGRPKGSLNKKSRPEKELSSEEDAEADGSPNSQRRGSGQVGQVEVNNSGEATQETSNGITTPPRRGRGRPRKIIEEKSVEQQLAPDGSQPVKRGRGRPKGSLNKKPAAYRMQGTVSRPRKLIVTVIRRGRPRRIPGQRGRPRKHPLPPPEGPKKPRVWKPLGRPRKYPRVEPPEGAPPAPRRRRGRPRKSDSKKGAHLRKPVPSSSSPSTTHNPEGPPGKRDPPPSTAESEGDAQTPRKRGRPKGSPNKNKANQETQLDSTLPNHSKAAESNSPAAAAAEVENEAVSVVKDVEQITETVPVKHGDETEETLIDQDVSFDVSNQA